jgi:ferric-dicitrate binding protein FerR (iron transport regulator)
MNDHPLTSSDPDPNRASPDRILSQDADSRSDPSTDQDLRDQGKARRSKRRRVIWAAIVGIPLLLCLGYWLIGLIGFADAASLIELKGIVQARHESSPEWDLARINQLVGRRHRIRTGDNSAAKLLFFDVSTVDLGENTEVSIAQCAKRRGGSAVDVVIKTWVGKTAIRAVRFIDPSSTFRLETPTASTVVRGARFTVEVDKDGTTQIDLEEGKAQVKVQDQIVQLGMGERITLKPDGDYETEQLFIPDAQPVVDKVTESWTAPEEMLDIKLTETEANQFLAAMSEQSDFFVRDTLVWFVKDEMRIETTVTTPATFDVSTAVQMTVTDGHLDPEFRSLSAGVALPIPAPILNMAMETVFAQIESYLQQAYDFVEFTSVEIHDGYVLVRGRKLAADPSAE